MNTIDKFGRDHANLLAYLETLVVDSTATSVNGHRVGEIDKRRVRCNPANGRGHFSNCSSEMPWKDSYGTRLFGGAQLPAHDDWDCIDEFEDAGLIDVVSAANGLFTLTAFGETTAARIRQHKAHGGQFATFPWVASGSVSP